MPEGHLVHRHARQLADGFAGASVAASSPQGRFSEGAAAIDGAALTATEAYGKRLFLTFGGDASRLLHVHLGRQGLWLWATADRPPRPSVRLRLASHGTTADLIAPIICELAGVDRRDAIVEKLGPDPLRGDADPERARLAIQASRRPIGALLLEQSTIAGLGNVLRAEILNIVGVHPALPGSAVDDASFDGLWTCATDVMRSAEAEGRIITRRPEGVVLEELDEVQGRFVYGRRTCGRCGRVLEQLTIGGRAIAACPRCQPRGG
jgi:endonuclease-8